MRLGEVLTAAGDPAAAALVLRQAWSLFREQHRDDLAERAAGLLGASPGDAAVFAQDQRTADDLPS
jgi:hypothetical protein